VGEEAVIVTRRFGFQGMDAERPTRGSGVSVAVGVAALVVSAGALFAASMGIGATRTITETTTTTVAPTSLSLHTVTFNETGTGCGGYGRKPTYAVNYAPRWYVTLGNLTVVQPSNATLPFPDGPGVNRPVYGMISKIVFTVPDGSYPYYVSLGNDPGNDTYTGTVVVNGADAVVQVTGPLCA
jgi:hypothetical protein